jgi:CBS domain-containing protein
MTASSRFPKSVDDIMTKRVTTIAAEASVGEAISLFEEFSFRHLVVVDDEKRLAGVLSDRDSLRYLARGRSSDQADVASIMKTDPVTVTPETPVKDAIDLLSFHRINCLPVVDARGRVCGIVTTTDLLGTLYDILERLSPRSGSAASPCEREQAAP